MSNAKSETAGKIDRETLWSQIVRYIRDDRIKLWQHGTGHRGVSPIQRRYSVYPGGSIETTDTVGPYATFDDFDRGGHIYVPLVISEADRFPADPDYSNSVSFEEDLDGQWLCDFGENDHEHGQNHYHGNYRHTGDMTAEQSAAYEARGYKRTSLAELTDDGQEELQRLEEEVDRKEFDEWFDRHVEH